MTRTFRPAPFAMLAIVLLAAAPGRADDDQAALFREEAPPGWKAIEAVTRHLAGHVVDTQDERVVGRAPRLFEAVYDAQADGDRTLVRLASDKTDCKDFGQRVLCLNGQRAFRLKRTAADRPWMVTYAGNDVATVKRPIDMYYSGLTAATQPYLHYRLVDLAAQPSFRVKECQTAEHNGRPMVKLEFSVDPFAADEGPFSIVGGMLLMDPADHWCLHEYRFDLQIGQSRGSTIAGTIEYEGQIGGVSLPSIHRRQFISRTKNTTDWTTVCSDIRSTQAASESFTLAAFGLPETGETPAKADDELKGVAPTLGVTTDLRASYERNGGLVLTFVAHVKNDSEQPVTILGAHDHCGGDGCFTTADLPLTIPAGETSDVTVSVSVGELPAAPLMHRLYTDRAGEGELRCNLDASIASQPKKTRTR
jgi:hypothetical protein